jgi:integrase
MARERKGSIVKRDGKIYGRVQFIDENGKKRDLWRKADNQKHAKEIIKNLLKETEEVTAKQIDGLNMTLAELAEHYIKNYLQEAVYVGHKKVSGVRGVKPALYAVKPLVEYFGNRKIKTITYGDIRTYKQVRFTTPTKHGTQRSIAAVNKELGKLKRMLNIAVREQWLSRSAFDNGESLIGDEIHRNRILTMEEEARLFIAIESKPKREHLKGIVLIALDCALRRGEIFKLRWSEVDLDKRTITVTAFNSKTARERTVATTIRVYNELEKLWHESDKDKNKLVFGVNVTIKTSWKKICREAKIVDFRFHDTRHTAISRMVEAVNNFV